MNNLFSYFKFLEIIRKSHPGGVVLDIDPISKLILDEIALHELNDEPLTITVMMSFLHIASQATIHRKLSYLVDKGYINSKCIGTNRRTKHLTITKITQRYYKTLSQAMNKACLAV